MEDQSKVDSSKPLAQERTHAEEAFDISLQDDDDEFLLDWRQFDNYRLGMFSPPLWWYRLTSTQRKQAKVLSACSLGTVFVLIMMILLAMGSGNNKSSDSTQLEAGSCNWADFRLPSRTMPTQYDLDLSVDLDTYEVQGMLSLHADQTEEDSCIVMHADPSMTVTAFSVLSGTTKLEGVMSYGTNKAAGDQLIVKFPRPVPAGQITIETTFNYSLSEGLEGFYRSSITGADDQPHTIAVTQFEALGARKAFPCFDEPDFKAGFNVTLTAPDGVKVLTNAPELRTEELPEGRTRHEHETTPPMSTYLVAFIIGDLASVEGTYTRSWHDDVTVRVWGAPSREGYFGLALDTAIASLKGYEQILGVRYPLVKLDLVAIPDFAAGAMENWGLITFRETDLLVPEGTSEASIQQVFRVPTVVAHEIAHMWFGDLVTLHWWSELWLNEGFATYFENIGAGFFWADTDTTKLGTSDINYMRSFYATASQALYTDSKNTSRALSLPDSAINSEDQAESIFDNIAYNKGGSVLRMLHAYLIRDTLLVDNAAAIVPSNGKSWALRRLQTAPLDPQGLESSTLDSEVTESSHGFVRKLQESAVEKNKELAKIWQDDPFFYALTAYLQAHKGGVASGNDLWTAVQDSTGLEVVKWMQSWTYQQGVPLLHVEMSDERDALVFSQSKFTRHGSVDIDCDFDPEASLADGESSGVVVPWWIPVGWKLGGGPSISWNELHGCSTTVVPGNLEALKIGMSTFKANVGQFGLYRTDYSSELWDLLHDSSVISDVTDASYIPDVDLGGLIGDSYALALADIQPPTRFLRFISALPTRAAAIETQHQAWQQATPLSHLLRMAPNTTCEKTLRNYVATSLIEPFVTASGLSLASVSPDDDAMTRLLRTTLNSLMVSGFSVPSYAVHAEATTLAYISRTGTLHPDVRESTMQLAVMQGNPGTWERIKAYYTSSSDTSEKAYALAALTHASSTELIGIALQFSLESEVRSQDMTRYIVGIAINSVDGRDLAWDFITSHEVDLKARFGGTTSVQNRSYTVLAAAVASKFATEERLAEAQDFFHKLYPDVEDKDLPVSVRRAFESIENLKADSLLLWPSVLAWLQAQGE